MSQGRQVLKVIYVVGNETARQGPADFDYSKTAPRAISKGIVVNAVYCGDADHAPATPTWREMAKLADGQYMEISRTGGALIVATPYDKELNDLSAKLNATYVAYGPGGRAGAENQAAQDTAAAGASAPTAADRAVAKSNRQYDNARWDLVDASREKSFKVEEVSDEQLPEEMRKLSVEQRKAYVEQKAKQRADPGADPPAGRQARRAREGGDREEGAGRRRRVRQGRPAIDREGGGEEGVHLRRLSVKRRLEKQ